MGYLLPTGALKSVGIFLLLIGLEWLAAPAGAITPNAQETEMGALIATHPNQGRPSMTYHPILNMVARFRALDMATRRYFSHTDPDGYGPNYAVKMAELALPDWYGQQKADNNIESIAAGTSTAQATFDLWMGSHSHKAHVLAEASFWQQQTYYGVGYYYNSGSPYGHYWVFISTLPDPDAVLSIYTEWLFDHLVVAQMDDPTEDPDRDLIKNLLEYVVDFDPATANSNRCYTFMYNPTNSCCEITVPIRSDIDPDVEVGVETRTNLTSGSWSTNSVQRLGNTFSADAIVDQQRFFRVRAICTTP